MRYCTCGHSDAEHGPWRTWCKSKACGCIFFTVDILSARIDAIRAKRRREDRAWKQALKKIEAER